VDSEYKLKGLITIKDIEKALAYPNAAKDESGRLLCGAAIGVTSDVLDRAGALVQASVDVLVLDSAHGHSQNIVNSIRKIKDRFRMFSYCRNIATAEGAEALIKAGQTALK
jgi:IMP dehydrogenase